MENLEKEIREFSESHDGTRFKPKQEANIGNNKDKGHPQSHLFFSKQTDREQTHEITESIETKARAH